MGLSLQPARLKRYGEIARLLYKDGRRDLVARTGLEESLAAGDASEAGGPGDPRDLAVFFLAAAAGGIWLAFNILHSDTPGKPPR